MTASLAITGGGLPPRTVELNPGTTTLGRADSNVIVLNHPNVSRSHLEIRVDGNGAQIADLNSVNGTRINDTKLDPHTWQQLVPGDVIEIGPFLATFEEEAEAGATVVMSRTVVMPRGPVTQPAAPPPPEPATPAPEPPAEQPAVAPIWQAPAPVVPSPSPVQQQADEPPPIQQPEPLWQQPPSQAAYATPQAAAPYAPAPRSGRDSLALLLLVLATILTLPAAFAMWDDRVLSNQDQFVKLGNKVLSQPAVQRELAHQLAADVDSSTETALKGIVPADLQQLGRQVLDSIFGPQSASTGANGQQVGFVEGLMLDVVRTLPNTPVSEAALIATHQAIKTALRDESIKANNGAIVLDISSGTNDLFKLAGVPGVTDSQLDDDWGRIEITHDADTVRAVKLLRFFDGKAVIFLVLVIAAVVAGLYFAADRARYTKLAGVAIAGSAVVWILAAKLPLKPWLLHGSGDTPSEKAAADAIYDVAVNSFVNQELVVIGIGVIILAVGLFMSSRAGRIAEPPVA